MEEVKQDVPVESSPTTEAVTPAEQPQQEEAKPVQPAPVTEVDESGVPWKNRAFEYKRKSEELAERLPSIVEEKLRSVLSSQNAQQREYTVGELEQYAIENPQYRPWVEEKKYELLIKKTNAEFESKINAEKAQTRADQLRQSSFQYVATTYPEILVKDQLGNLVGFDNSHPMVQQINLLMSNKTLADNPEGLMAAADIAWARLSRSNQAQQVKKENQLKAEVKDLQKKTLVESGGKSNMQPVPTHRQAIEKLKQTGSMKDARLAVSELLKARGIGE